MQGNRRQLKRLIGFASVALLLAGGALVASWFDVVPGGWRLRKLVHGEEGLRRRETERHREARLAAFRTESIAVEPGMVIFYGSSTIERFPLATSFPGRGVVNRGIGLENAVDLRERLGETLPDDVRAAVAGVVIYAGGIDLRRDELAPTDAAARVERVIEKARRVFPAAKLLLLGVLPGRVASERANGPLWAELVTALRDLARKTGATFVATDRPPLVTDAKTLAARYTVDDWHLNEDGYRLLASWIVADGGAVGRLLAP